MPAVSVCFILVEPATPENVGASARAIKTMGFTDLRLVNPCNHLEPKAQWVAYNSEEILRGARVFANLKDALEGCDFAIATTARRRHVRFDYHDVSEVLGLVSGKGSAVRRVAVVFGRESCGLTNDEMLLCDVASGVPLKSRQPVLNLSHAVMLYAYHLSPLAMTRARIRPEPAPPGEYQALKRAVVPLLERLGIPPGEGFHERVLERLGALNKEDVHILHSISRRVKRAIGAEEKRAMKAEGRSPK